MMGERESRAIFFVMCFNVLVTPIMAVVLWVQFSAGWLRVFLFVCRDVCVGPFCRISFQVPVCELVHII